MVQSSPNFFVQHGRDNSRSSLFPIVDVLMCSEDTGDQTLKFFKIAHTVNFGQLTDGARRYGGEKINNNKNCCKT